MVQKQTQFILFFIGFGIAILFNIDSIEITKTLSTDDTTRNQIVKMAESFNDNVKVPSNDFYKYIGRYLNQDSTMKGKDSIQWKYAMIKLLAQKNDSVSKVMGLGWIKQCNNANNVCCYSPPQSTPQAILGGS